MATANRRLTATRIRNFTYDQDGASKQVLWDGTLPPFGVRAYPTGRKSYVLRYGPTRKILTLGPCVDGREVEEMRSLARGILQEYKTDDRTAHQVSALQGSESTEYAGRAVVALATDAKLMEKTGRVLRARELGPEYGFTDVDRRQPSLDDHT